MPWSKEGIRLQQIKWERAEKTQMIFKTFYMLVEMYLEYGTQLVHSIPNQFKMTYLYICGILQKI